MAVAQLSSRAPYSSPGARLASRGFRQQDPGQERPHRRRQPPGLQPQRRTQHHQQGGGGHHLARLRRRQQPEEGVQQIAPRHHQRGDGAQTKGHPAQTVGQRHRRAPRCQKGHQRQQGHDGQVLQQQDRDNPLPLGQRDRAALFQHLHDDGGRGQHEPGARDQRRRHRIAQRQPHRPQQPHADQHLHKAKTENVAPHRPQARGLHFQTDDEQEHHHAQFRHMQDRHGVGKEPEPPGADGQPCRQIPQHRPQPQPLEQRHGNHRSGQQDHHRRDVGAMGGGIGGVGGSFGGHGISPGQALRASLPGDAVLARPIAKL